MDSLLLEIREVLAEASPARKELQRVCKLLQAEGEAVKCNAKSVVLVEALQTFLQKHAAPGPVPNSS